MRLEGRPEPRLALELGPGDTPVRDWRLRVHSRGRPAGGSPRGVRPRARPARRGARAGHGRHRGRASRHPGGRPASPGAPGRIRSGGRWSPRRPHPCRHSARDRHTCAPTCTGVGGVPSTIRTAGGVPERDDRSRSVRDRPGCVRESDPQRIRVPVDRRAEEALAEVECDGALLEPAKRHGRDERGEVAQAGHERQDPGDGRDAGVRRSAGRSGGRSRTRDQDRDGEADRRGGGDPQTRAGITDAVTGGPEEQERRDRLDGEEVARRRRA